MIDELICMLFGYNFIPYIILFPKGSWEVYIG